MTKILDLIHNSRDFIGPTYKSEAMMRQVKSSRRDLKMIGCNSNRQLKHFENFISKFCAGHFFPIVNKPFREKF